MVKKLTIFLSVFTVTALLGVTSVLAHVHPLVPFECAEGDGAGNTADPQNDGVGQTFVGPGLGFIPHVNPGSASLPLSPVDRPSDIPIGGPGVETATGNCKNAP